MKFLALILLYFCAFNVLGNEAFPIYDENQYPKYSKNAVTAVIDDLRKNNVETSNLYILVKCREKYCDLEVSFKDNFKPNESIRGCPDFCVYYGYNNEHNYIFKKAHIR
ncbi:hypothetical protein J3L16_15470 [Alteromonas sp. 5E99-2]|uniref:hypothetical protein n=1 Tax=Alteromonas sp. 5E99-2 TaxID=2817683 RepID=UPI001A98B50A|nr:hypothetical protein [Alteromonas sp. 5E99-2]MBO1257083.1 hypothetical protein [Alteromonas sp. 5E99-2]